MEAPLRRLLLALPLALAFAPAAAQPYVREAMQRVAPVILAMDSDELAAFRDVVATCQHVHPSPDPTVPMPCGVAAARYQLEYGSGLSWLSPPLYRTPATIVVTAFQLANARAHARVALREQPGDVGLTELVDVVAPTIRARYEELRRRR